jgi:hypothetical protein
MEHGTALVFRGKSNAPATAHISSKQPRAALAIYTGMSIVLLYLPF